MKTAPKLALVMLFLTVFHFFALCVVRAEPAPTTREIVDEKVKQKQRDQSLLDLYLQGGWLMHPIALCSMGTIAVGAYCALQVTRGRFAPGLLMHQLKPLMAQRDVATAFQVCRAHPGPLGNTLGAALVKANFERDLFNKPAMEQAATETIVHEETRYMLWINYLNVFATIAPMLGLLGTVVGMIEAFNSLAAGLSEPEDLANGIGVAMITTAGGLIVGIPSMFLFFFFRNNLQGAVADLQKAATNLLDLFTGEAGPEPGA